MFFATRVPWTAVRVFMMLYNKCVMRVLRVSVRELNQLVVYPCIQDPVFWGFLFSRDSAPTLMVTTMYGSGFVEARV